MKQHCLTCNARLYSGDHFCRGCGSTARSISDKPDQFSVVAHALSSLSEFVGITKATNTGFLSESEVSDLTSDLSSESRFIFNETIALYRSLARHYDVHFWLYYRKQKVAKGDRLGFELELQSNTSNSLSVSISDPGQEGNTPRDQKVFLRPFSSERVPLTCTVEGGGHQRIKGINLVLKSTIEPQSVELEIDEFLLSTEHAVTSIVNTITNTVNIKGRGVVDASGLAAGQESKEAIEVIELTSSIKAPLLTDFFSEHAKDDYLRYIACVLGTERELKGSQGLDYALSRPLSEEGYFLALHSRDTSKTLRLHTGAISIGGSRFEYANLTEVELFALNEGKKVMLTLHFGSRKTEVLFSSDLTPAVKLIARFLKLSARQ